MFTLGETLSTQEKANRSNFLTVDGSEDQRCGKLLHQLCCYLLVSAKCSYPVKANAKQTKRVTSSSSSTKFTSPSSPVSVYLKQFAQEFYDVAMSSVFLIASLSILR